METTYSKDGFIFFRNKNSVDSIFDESLIIEPSKIKEAIAYINGKDLKSVMINSNYGKLTSLSFLEATPNLESLKLLDEGLNIEAINNLKRLKELRIGKVNSKIDFTNFKMLQVLGATYNSSMDLSECKNLFWLWLDNFSEINLESISTLVNLEYLNFYNTSIIDLEGLESFINIKKIVINSGKKLKSLAGLSKENGQLNAIDIYNAKKLIDYTSLINLSNIQYLRMVKTGDIANLDFIKDLVNLNTIILGLKVIDGNTKILDGITSHQFKNYPHYNYKSPKFVMP